MYYVVVLSFKPQYSGLEPKCMHRYLYLFTYIVICEGYTTFVSIFASKWDRIALIRFESQLIWQNLEGIVADGYAFHIVYLQYC